jgi:hypothetical protein
MNSIMTALCRIIVSLLTLFFSSIANRQTDSTKAPGFNDSTENTILKKLRLKPLFPEGKKHGEAFLRRI